MEAKANDALRGLNTRTRVYFCYIELRDRTITAYLTKDQILEEYTKWLGLENSIIYANESIDFLDEQGIIKLRLRGHK